MLASSNTSVTTKFRSQDLSAPWRHVDVVLVVTSLIIAGIGLALVHSATLRLEGGFGIVARQGVFVLIGLAAMAGLAMTDYRRILDWWPVLYVGSMLLLVGVMTPLGATGAFGAARWYSFGPVVLQPVEFSKIGVIVALAAYLAAEERLDLRRLAFSLLLVGLPFGATMLQPDLGSALVFAAVGVAMLVVGGIRLRHLAVLALIGLVAVAGVLQSDVLDDYQKQRLLTFANPDAVDEAASYNVTQAQVAISSGGLTGFGFGNGPSTRLGYVPAQRTDFIFTVVGEEFGFVGAGTLLLLYSVLIWRIWRAAQLAASRSGTLLCVGVMAMLLFHVFENVGMNLGIMPVTGLPLPLVSQGGSSVMATFAALGLVLSVHMRRYR